MKVFMVNQQARWVAAFTALSWLGMFVHNSLELPTLTLLSPENSLMAFISVLLFMGWWLTPARRVAATLLLGLSALHLIGGAFLSVLPLGFLPFYPEQTLQHYIAHG